MNNQLFVNCALMIRKVMKLCCVRDLLRSFAHFMLYSSIVCYEIHVKLVHITARWIGTIVYRVTLNEMLVCTFSIHARMTKFCQDVCSDNLWLYAHVRIWRDVIDACLVVWLLSYASVWTSCLVNRSISRFRLIALHVKIYKFWRDALLVVVMLKFWRDVFSDLYISQSDRCLRKNMTRCWVWLTHVSQFNSFCMSSSNEMSFQLIVISLPTCALHMRVKILTRCLQWFIYFAIYDFVTLCSLYMLRSCRDVLIDNMSRSLRSLLAC